MLKTRVKSFFVHSLLLNSLLRRHLVPAQHYHDRCQLALLLFVRSKCKTMEGGVFIAIQVWHNSHVNHFTSECHHWPDNANVSTLGELWHWRIIDATTQSTDKHVGGSRD